jgi:NADH dehydrogenase/NADH:ubiquinone oxidoreductase subunit G
MLDITIDGIQASVNEGQTILDAARKLGIEIPTLCFHRSVRPHRACRICTVEVTRGDKVSYLTACSYKIAEPLTVNTRSEGALARRREIAAGLLASSAGAPAVRRIAREAGISDLPDGQENRCIRCGLCVRVCDQVIGRKALTYEKGAADTPYTTVTDRCIGCGTCAAVCPTGAIAVTDKNGVRRFEQGKREFTPASCGTCGRPITTEEHLSVIREKRSLPDDVALVCPSCKRARFGDRVLTGLSVAPQNVS